MTARRGATGLSGVLVLDKPAGMTSHDVVARIRRVTGERRVGHAGTLDPLATGVLIVLVGSATRLERYLSGQDKSYRALIAFGSETDTLDADGTVVAKHAVPSHVLDDVAATRILESFIGMGTQIPPTYSAIKRDGVPAHRLARAGVEVEMQPRTITVHKAALKGIDQHPTTWDVDFSVSKGTYIRSLAKDIGTRAGSGAHLAGLRRTSIGALSIKDAYGLDEVCDAASAGVLSPLFTDPVPTLGFPTIDADPVTVRTGRSIDVPPSLSLADGERVAMLVDGLLGGVYRKSSRGLIPEAVFIPEVAR